MRRSVIGLLASFVLGAAAFAGQTAEEQNPPPPTKPADGSKAANSNGPSQFGRADDRAASSLDTHHDLAKNEVTGKIVRADGNTVWIDHMGAVIPLRIEPNTRFESAGIARPKDLKEGQEIRASFTVQNKTTNVADSIWLEGATATGTRPTPRAKGVK